MLLKYLHVSYYWKELPKGIHFITIHKIVSSPPPHAGKNITTIKKY